MQKALCGFEKLWYNATVKASKVVNTNKKSNKFSGTKSCENLTILSDSLNRGNQSAFKIKKVLRVILVQTCISMTWISFTKLN